jgi:hypothetical protein
MGESSSPSASNQSIAALIEPDDDWKELGNKCTTEAKFLDLVACLIDKHPDDITECATEFFASLPSKLIKESDLPGLVEEVFDDTIKSHSRGNKLGSRCGRMWTALSKVVDTTSYDFEVLLNRAMRRKSIDVLEWFVTSIANPTQIISIRDWIYEQEDEDHEKYRMYDLLAIVEELGPVPPEVEKGEKEEERKEEEKKEEEKKEEEKKEEKEST